MKQYRQLVYKVVEKNYLKKNQYCSFLIRDVNQIIIYKPNNIAESAKDSLGIFCFKDYKSAWKWSSKFNLPNKAILSAIGYGKSIVPKKINLVLYGGITQHLRKNDIDGVVCFKKIKVLKEEK